MNFEGLIPISLFTQGEEVNLLVERGGQFIAIECKYAEHVDRSSLKGINALIKSYGSESLIAGYVASKTPRAILWQITYLQSLEVSSIECSDKMWKKK